MRRSFEGKRHQPAKSEEKRKRCDRKHRGFGFFCAFLLCAGLISGGAAVSGESGAQEAVNAEAPADDAVQPEAPAQPVEEAQQNTPAPEDTEGGGEAGQQQEETPDQQQEELYPEDDGNGEESVPSVSRPDAGSAESSAAPVGTTAEPLTVSVTTAMKYAFAGENVLTFETQITGGTEPFETSCEIDRDGTPVWSSQEYQPEVTYMPEEAGGYELVLSVTDAAGQAASGRCAIPVAVRHEESPSDWEPALKEVRMTGRYAEDLLAIARTQLGYTESADNFIVTEEGARQGYTRYGQWQGDAYEPWDAAFAAFCLYYAGVRDVPADTKAEKWADELKRRGMYRDLTAENRPEEGDFLFTRDGEVTRIGLVEKTDDTGVTAIEGDVGGAVARVTYGWDDARLAGFGDPRTTLTDEAAGVTVTGIFPEGATLTVQLLAEDADGFTEAQDRIHAALSPLYDRYAVNLADVTETAVYVPSLTVNGEVVSPCKKVRVGVSACGGRFAGHGDVRVLTFSDEQTELLSAEEKDGGDGADAIVSASFRTDRLSEFALTAVAPDRLTMRRTAADGDAKVTVTYGAGAGVPESAELRVRQIRGDGDDADRAEYQKRQAEAAALLETEAGGENAASQPDTAASGSPGNAENADVSRQTDQNAENAAADQQADQNAENVAADQTEDSKEYAAYMEEVEAALASGRKVQMAKLFDITILDKEGNEVEPLTPVRANIEFAPKEVQEGTDLELYQFQTEGEKPQVMENVEVLTDDDNIVNGIEFETDGFSVYGIVGTEVLTGGVMTADGDSYSVTVKYDKYAEIPDDAVLVATEVQNSSRLYQSYMSEAEDALTSDSDAEISFARFFDVSIMADGEKIQPATPAEVIIDYNESQEITEGTEVSTLQFGDSVPATVDAAVSGTDTQVDGVSFQAEEVSVYGIVGTETITVEHIDHKGTKYEVTVTYGPEAKIPEGSTLRVTDIDEGTDEYEYARNAVLADKQAKGEEVFLPEFGFAALDISILNPEGEEIEPAAPVQVDIKIKSLPNVEDLNEVAGSIEIQHHVETGDKVVVDTVYDGGSTEAKFNVETNEKAIVEGTAIDPTKYEPEEAKGLESLDEIVTSFETGAFSTYTISWGNRRYNIHYVDTNGGSLTPTRTPEFSNGYKFLIYDVEGYEYDSTHYGSRTGTAIKPLLANYGNDRVYLDNSNNWQYLRNDIYVVYKAKKTPSQGGTPQVDQDEKWPDQDTPAKKPQFTKSSTNNGNGTNNISLTITGPEKPVEKSTPADVIVVFDISGSMKNNMNGQTRLQRAKTAVNTMANTLLNGQNSDVRMALISFSTTAQQVNITGATNGFTSNYNNFSAAVNGLSADGGTNWEQALQLANTLPVRDNAATFVVFVTDGDPTFRKSRGDIADSQIDEQEDDYGNPYTGFYTDNLVYGEGDDDSLGLNFDFAVDQVSAIAGANKNFYAIGISNDVTKVKNLTTRGGVAEDHAFIASNSEAMEKAFKSITESIKSILGFGNIEMTDGITSLTSAEMKVMQSVDPNSFKYYRYGGENNKYGNGYANKTEWMTREADGCAAATYSEADGAVHWNMGETFQLESDVTYVVEFTVWPSQAAYDLVADLNNGLKTFDGLTPEEKAQVVELAAPTPTTTGTYALKTNTDKVETTYNRTTKTGDTVTVSDTTNIKAEYHEGDIQNMDLDSDYIVVHKKWNNELDGRTGEGVSLSVTKDNVVYLSDVDVNDGNHWTSDKQYISAGFITKTSGGLYNVRELGHDYTVTEPESLSYYWDLTADIYRPMVIDGTLHVLIKTDSPTGTEGTDYFRIPSNSSNYYQVKDGNITLEASNDRRSVLDLKKVVTQDTGAADVPNPDATFTYAVTDTDVAGADVWFSAQDSAGATMEIPNTSSNVVAEMKDGVLTGYYHVPSGDPFTIDIKADWSVRFINLPTGSTYSIQETDKGEDEGFQFVDVVTAADNGGTAGTVSGADRDTVTGTIDKPNNVFSATYTNKWLTKEIQIVKIDENGDMLADATFTLTKGRNTVSTFTSESTEGETIALGKGTYCLTETAAPAGYIILSNKIYFNVNADGTVALSNEEGGTEGVTYENATVSNPPTTELGTVTVSNEPGKELPHTGGPGTLLYALSGLMLILASALIYGFRMRRGERRIR